MNATHQETWSTPTSRTLAASLRVVAGASTAAAALLRPPNYFADRGIQIREVISGNAFTYRHPWDFRDGITALGARQAWI